MMTASLRTLLSHVLDYAGLFPPARLSLEETLRNYARYRTEPEGWMLGRLVLPAARLSELDAFSELFAAGPPFTFSILGRGGESAEAFQAGVQADLGAIQQFRNRHGRRVVVDAFEVKLPLALVEQTGTEILQTPTRALQEAGLSVVYEPPQGTDWKGLLARLANSGAGVKLRCGGLEAGAFPSAEQVAQALALSRDHGVPLKCTAGLHHPLRRFDTELQTPMHGFVNVFLAGVLAHCRGLNQPVLEALLLDDRPAHFVLGEEEVRWTEYRASREEIAQARHQAVLSFGSCSFDEPRADLRALGWLT